VVGSVVPVLVMAIATFMILNQLRIAPEIVTITYAAPRAPARSPRRSASADRSRTPGQRPRPAAAPRTGTRRAARRRRPEQTLLALARQAATSLVLAGAYTDAFDIARRRRETTPAAEIQQNLLPPRIARITGALLAGNVLPGYEIGGDWFDYVENRNGAWLGVADSMGHGTTAAALGAVALGAFRAKRKVTADLEAAVLAIHHTIRETAIEGAFVNATIARWHGPSSTFSWITCGDQSPLLIDSSGDLSELRGPAHNSLGLGHAERTFEVALRRLNPGDRVLLISDGVLERRTHGGKHFGLDGIRNAIRKATGPTPAETVRALENAVTSTKDRLEDDSTIVVLTPTSLR
jgi:serine phosphatase RsbU (regulator of sigma subunit)